MKENGHRENSRVVHPLPEGQQRVNGSATAGTGAPGARTPAGGAKAAGRRLGFTKWTVFVLSAVTAFIIAGGSAVLGAITFAKGVPAGYGWLCLGLLTGLVAMANDIRSQLQQPPVDLRRA